jgi:hypothetical protein
MKYIILQHWSGEMNELSELSSHNISQYAKNIGVDYQLIRGDSFRPNLPKKHPPLQKLAMLNEEFDEYDMTVMLDTDMFARKGIKENIFTDVEGIGVHTGVQKNLAKHMKQILPHISNPEYCYWGGAIYRLTREQRILLRAGIKEDEIPLFCGKRNHGDEGLMHTLAVRAKIKNCYIPDTHWNYPSFWDEPDKAAIIHIRTKYKSDGKLKKREKMINYKELVKKGIIE